MHAESTAAVITVAIIAIVVISAMVFLDPKNHRWF